MNRRPQSALDAVLALVDLRGWIATVESCTGGALADRITDIPGASSVYYGGWVTYDNAAKEGLGVSDVMIRKHGAVSAEVAAMMAESGVRAMETGLNTRGRGRPLLCVATTGVAGPSGGTATKPVGLCWIAVARLGKPTLTLSTTPVEGFDRETYKKHFADEALRLILRACKS